jgi:signal peptidase II
MRRSWPSALLAIASVAALVGCDHATKVAAVSALRDQGPVSLVRGALDLSYVENRDVAFDTLSRASLRLPAVALGAFALAMAFVVTVVWVRRGMMSWPAHAGFAMVVAGAIGNGIDRFQRGHVVDFIHLHHWPVFNVADVLVVCGMGLLVLGRQPASPAAE